MGVGGRWGRGVSVVNGRVEWGGVRGGSGCEVGEREEGTGWGGKIGGGGLARGREEGMEGGGRLRR